MRSWWTSRRGRRRTTSCSASGGCWRRGPWATPARSIRSPPACWWCWSGGRRGSRGSSRRRPRPISPPLGWASRPTPTISRARRSGQPADLSGLDRGARGRGAGGVRGRAAPAARRATRPSTWTGSGATGWRGGVSRSSRPRRRWWCTRIELVEYAPPELVFRVTVSAGTYVRALARDLGERLGVGAHLTALRRESIGALRVEDAVPLAEVDAVGGPAGPGGARAPARRRARRARPRWR